MTNSFLDAIIFIFLLFIPSRFSHSQFDEKNNREKIKKVHHLIIFFVSSSLFFPILLIIFFSFFCVVTLHNQKRAPFSPIQRFWCIFLSFSFRFFLGIFFFLFLELPPADYARLTKDFVQTISRHFLNQSIWTPDQKHHLNMQYDAHQLDAYPSQRDGRHLVSTILWHSFPFVCHGSP